MISTSGHVAEMSYMQKAVEKHLCTQIININNTIGNKSTFANVYCSHPEFIEIICLTATTRSIYAFTWKEALETFLS